MNKRYLLLSLLVGFSLICSLSANAQFSAERRAYVESISVPDHPDRVYAVGEQATLRLEAYAGGVPVDGVWVRYQSGDELMPPQVKDSVQFRKGVAYLPIGTRTEPGFKTISYQFEVAGQKYRDMVNVGFSPEKLQPLTPVPADFDAFWANALAEAEAVDLNPVVTPLPQYSTETVEVSKVKLTVGPGGRNIYAYLSRPKDGKKHPVLFDPPGAGNRKRSPSTFYADRGYIYMNINIHHDADSELPDDQYNTIVNPIADYTHMGIEDPDSFYYKAVYAACSRCIDYLCSLPDWDGKNVGVTGGSQGGALTIVTAALNDKVTFCAPFYPALCDLLGATQGRAPGWPKYFLNGPEKQGAEKTLAYYDVANFARKVTCPVFYSFGYNDPTCCPTSTYAVYNVITAPKTLAATFTNGHWRFSVTNQEAIAWMKSQLK